jgi:hypothetical protein
MSWIKAYLNNYEAQKVSQVAWGLEYLKLSNLLL